MDSIKLPNALNFAEIAESINLPLNIILTITNNIEAQIKKTVLTLKDSYLDL